MGNKPKWKLLGAGILLMWVVYFAVRIFMFLPCETARGKVTNMYWAHFNMRTRRGKITKGEYLCPEVTFRYYAAAGDTGTIFTAQPQAFSFRDYHVGDDAGVYFPKGHPEQAALYSAWEYWLTPANAIILLAVSVLGFIVFFVVTFKPWRSE